MSRNKTEAEVSTRNTTKPKVECECCGLFGLCKVAGLGEPSEELLDKVVSRQQPISQGKYLAEAGAPFMDIYAVKSGSFKTYATIEDNREQVIDFHFPGELIGLEGISAGKYPYSVLALESSSVCKLHFDQLDQLGERTQEFLEQLVETMSRRALQDQWVPILMGAQSAEQRMAVFLLSLSARFAERELPSVEFKLPMSRNDIAHYLGLAVETVSRMFQRFQAQGLLNVRGRSIQLSDFEALREVAGLKSVTTPSIPSKQLF